MFSISVKIGEALRLRRHLRAVHRPVQLLVSSALDVSKTHTVLAMPTPWCIAKRQLDNCTGRQNTHNSTKAPLEPPTYVSKLAVSRSITLLAATRPTRPSSAADMDKVNLILVYVNEQQRE
jgi:hypothetical protein